MLLKLLLLLLMVVLYLLLLLNDIPIAHAVAVAHRLVRLTLPAGFTRRTSDILTEVVFTPLIVLLLMLVLLLVRLLKRLLNYMLLV